MPNDIRPDGSIWFFVLLLTTSRLWTNLRASCFCLLMSQCTHQSAKPGSNYEDERARLSTTARLMIYCTHKQTTFPLSLPTLHVRASLLTSLFYFVSSFLPNLQDPAGIFELIEVVGNGTYGQVYKVSGLARYPIGNGYG